MEKEQIHSKLKSLVQKFEANKYHYLSKKYLEEEAKIDFINPFFEVLGWDVRNTKGLSPYEREVVVEKGETLGRPDYNFRIDGQTKFFVEAKAPHEPLHKINHVLQAKSYAWNTKSVFIVLLTDFEEFRLFDATIKPDTKNPDQGLIFELTYDQYLDNVDRLMLLSKEEVEKGSLDKLILKDPKSKKLRIPVDKAFLADLSQWREELAKDIYKRNIKELEDRSDEKRVKIQVKILNEAVQKILNRLIFIRITEDRKIIEPKSLLDQVEWWKAGGKRRDLHRRLTNCFMGWNQDFDGEILKPGPCDILEIDSQLLAKIIDGLYFPKCPYLFDVIGVELLGSIYERYLGKTIRVTPKRVKIEERPEVRKAGGVYYTPQYIVDYIVKNTVAKTIKGKTPKRIKKIKILDPACGSGSFLLTAFQTLIDYHLDYYEKHPEESGQGTLFPDVIVDYDGTKRLSIEKKAQILRNNIYGVDIDPQAVEIAMMSLYLKCLEGEKDLPRKKELLPSLAKNIRCGNSLISYDIFDQLTLFDEEEKERINPFDWHSKSTGFGEIMEQGGFDVVIGNPPYIRIQTSRHEDIAYYASIYRSAVGNYDIYCLFVEKGTNLLKSNGSLGYILPHRFFKTEYGKGLRAFIVENKNMNQIIDFNGYMVFEQASINTCILILNKIKLDKFFYGKILFKKKLKEEVKTLLSNIKAKNYSNKDIVAGFIPLSLFSSKPWIFVWKNEMALWKKLNSIKKRLDDISDYIFQGLKTGSDKIYIVDLVKNKDDKTVIFCKTDSQEYEIESDIMKPLIKGGQMRRFYLGESSKVILFPYENGMLIPEHKMNLIYPKAWAYLLQHKPYLENREKGKMKGTQWYAYTRNQALKTIYLPKIITPDYYSHASYCLDKEGKFFFCGGGAGGYGIVLKSNFNPMYVLGLLNSKLLDWYLHKITIRAYQSAYMYVKKYITQLPIRTIDFNKPKEKTMHDKMVDLVDKMLELNKKKAALPPSSKRDRIKREIQITDEKIDELVYELYGITEDDRKIIEGEI